MDILWETIAFVVKAIVVVVAFGAAATLIASLVRRARMERSTPQLEVHQLNDQFEDLSDALRFELADRKTLKQLVKERKHARKTDRTDRPTVFVVDFVGDIFASATRSLREEVTAISAVAGPNDEVVVRLESPGGAVPHYGLAAAQLVRLKDRNIKVTACIDRIAASGGYMMACVAHSIVAAPFSIIGSIGVIAQVPNVHRLLKKHDIDYEELTAGEFKRTVSTFAEISEKGRTKFQEQLEETQKLFKNFVKSQRSQIEIDRVSTGEYWMGQRALELGLVDLLGTSDDYLVAKAKEARVLKIKYVPDLTLRERFGRGISTFVDSAISQVVDRWANARFW